MKRVAILIPLLVSALLVGCFSAVTDEPANPSPIPSSTFTETVQPASTITITPTFCPPPTPEPLWVEPVTSPTDSLTQVITVHVGYGVEVTVAAESGTFTQTGSFSAYGDPALVEITLLPDTVHHLKVTATVRSIALTGPDNCTYGYTLTTAMDRNGVPLIIVQGSGMP